MEITTRLKYVRCAAVPAANSLITLVVYPASERYREIHARGPDERYLAGEGGKKP